MVCYALLLWLKFRYDYMYALTLKLLYWKVKQKNFTLASVSCLFVLFICLWVIYIGHQHSEDPLSPSIILSVVTLLKSTPLQLRATAPISFVTQSWLNPVLVIQLPYKIFQNSPFLCPLMSGHYFHSS